MHLPVSKLVSCIFSTIPYVPCVIVHVSFYMFSKFGGEDGEDTSLRGLVQSVSVYRITGGLHMYF